jgi:hypothetical protein
LRPEVQQALLVNERLMRIITCVLIERSSTAGTLSADQRGRLEEAVLNWNSLPESKRVAAEHTFKQMLAGSIEAAPLGFSQADREEMQRALDAFKRLSPERQNSCLRNFAKFAGMSTEDRNAFLQSAEEWQNMSSKDREVWRSLVKRSRAFPPFPPGFFTKRLPPMPQPGSLATTNPGGGNPP